MSTIIVTGHEFTDPEAIFQLLTTAGVNPEKQMLSSNIQNLSDWHEHVFQQQKNHLSNLTPEQPWIEAADTLFKLNADSSLWGWGNHKSTWLLDYWYSFFPSNFFVLLYLPFQITLGKAIYQSKITDQQSVLEIFNEWKHYNQRLQSFQYLHQERCLLLNSQQIFNNSSEFISLISDKFNLSLDSSNIRINTDNGSKDQLGQILAEMIIQQHIEMHDADNDIEASIYPLSSNHNINNSVFPETAIIELQNYQKNNIDLNFALQKNREFEQILQNKDKTHIQLIHDNEQNIKQLHEEKEIVQLQFNQAREELEYYFHVYQEEKKRGDILTETGKQIPHIPTKQIHNTDIWQYQQIELKNEQTNPDYEHLWFNCKNAKFADKIWQNFEFRLGNNIVLDNKQLSANIKLEFPKPELLPFQFENWYVESRDDYGEKFELRFNTNDKAIDLAVWNKLSSCDQKQLIAIINDIPACINYLINNKVRISRPWNDWKILSLQLIKLSQELLVNR